MLRYLRNIGLCLLAPALAFSLVGCAPTSSSGSMKPAKMDDKMGGKMDDKMGGKMENKMGGKMDDKK